MPKYLVFSHILDPKILFSKLDGLDRVVLLNSETIGKVGTAEIESNMPINEIYKKLGYDMSQVTIGPIRKYKPC
jgi:hypothetical protein